MSDRTSNVAIYWDFENIQASLVEKRGGRDAYGRTKYQQQELLIDVDSVMEYAATFGVVSINRAYCNWQWYGKYREPLLRNGLELIQLFHPGASAKNGGDIKLALDCTEDLLRFPHVDVVVIVGGDSDYLPLAQKIKALGKNLVGIGTQANTNRHWARSCHEFKFYEALILDDESSAPAPQNQPAAVANAQVVPEVHPDNVVMTPPEELLRRAILRLSGKGGDSWVLKGSIRPMMKRMDPTFDEEQHGARSFGAFIRRFENLLEVRAGRNDQEIRLRGAAGNGRAAEAGPDTNGERGPREERGRDRHERRREAPTDRSPGRVAERIAQALERTPEGAPEASTENLENFGNEMRPDGNRANRFPENRQRPRDQGRGRDRGRDRDGRAPSPDAGDALPGGEAPELGQIPSTRTDSAAGSVESLRAIGEAPAHQPDATPQVQPGLDHPGKSAIETTPVPERRSRQRDRGRKPLSAPAAASASTPPSKPAPKAGAKPAPQPAKPRSRAPRPPKA